MSYPTPDGHFCSWESPEGVEECWEVSVLWEAAKGLTPEPVDLATLDGAAAGIGLFYVTNTATVDSTGARVVVQDSRNQLVRIVGLDSDAVNWSWLCDKGRYGFEAVNSDDRLGEPLVRAGDELVPAH